MYLLDTNVVSELRKKQNANPGVQAFFAELKQTHSKTYLSVITVGELRRGVELIRYRGDHDQAQLLETWLNGVIESYQGSILDFTATEAQVWGKLRVPHYENALDKQIAATALVYDLTLVTRNTADFLSTGTKLLNPFE
ncbi:MAG: type II toxin-antitoxin system VapC family toxin [Hahellaceae bacterium]|nr:type II toxin-antitoxin system VapC family toxin [Hahellaceae bacterium]